MWGLHERRLGVAIELPRRGIEDGADGMKDFRGSFFVFCKQLGTCLLQYLGERLRVGLRVVTRGQFGNGDERGAGRGHRRGWGDLRGREERGPYRIWRDFWG